MLFAAKRFSAEHSRTPPEESKAILTQLNDVSQVSHPLNINKKYELFIRLEPNKFAGNGFRRVAFVSIADQRVPVPDDAGGTARESEGVLGYESTYLETRTSGQPQIWDVLKRAVTNPNGKTWKYAQTPRHSPSSRRTESTC